MRQADLMHYGEVILRQIRGEGCTRKTAEQDAHDCSGRYEYGSGCDAQDQGGGQQRQANQVWADADAHAIIGTTPDECIGLVVRDHPPNGDPVGRPGRRRW